MAPSRGDASCLTPSPARATSRRSPSRRGRRPGDASVPRPLGRGGHLPGAGGAADHAGGGGLLGAAHPERRRTVRRHGGTAGELAGGPGRDRDPGHRGDPAAGRHRGDPQRRVRRRDHRRAAPAAARRSAVGGHQRPGGARGPRVHRLRRVRRLLGPGQRPSPASPPADPDRRRLRCRVPPGRPGRARRRRGHRPGQGTAGRTRADHRRERAHPRDRPTDRADGRAPAAADAHDLRVREPGGQVAAAHRGSPLPGRVPAGPSPAADGRVDRRGRGRERRAAGPGPVHRTTAVRQRSSPARRSGPPAGSSTRPCSPTSNAARRSCSGSVSSWSWPACSPARTGTARRSAAPCPVVWRTSAPASAGSGDRRRAGRWVETNVGWLRVVVVALGVVVLLWGNNVTTDRLWWSLALVLVLLAGLQVLVGAGDGRGRSSWPARREHPASGWSS